MRLLANMKTASEPEIDTPPPYAGLVVLDDVVSEPTVFVFEV